MITIIKKIKNRKNLIIAVQPVELPSQYRSNKIIKIETFKLSNKIKNKFCKM